MKPHKSRESLNSNNWYSYRMKKNYELVTLLIGLVIYSGYALLVLSKYIHLNDIVGSLTFILGIASAIIAAFYIKEFLKYI